MRQRLANRRNSQTFNFECNGLRYTATASWFDDGRLGEVFVGNHRADSHADAISHYDCLDFPALASLPIAELAADNCALFLWVTDPLLPRAIELMEAWGFEYKTVAFYWVKLNTAAKHPADYFTGLGYWTRANPEQCLLGTRAKPPRQAKNVKRLIVEKRREHSRKPECVRERIEKLVAGPYLELFARETK